MLGFGYLFAEARIRKAMEAADAAAQTAKAQYYATQVIDLGRHPDECFDGAVRAASQTFRVTAELMCRGDAEVGEVYRRTLNGLH